MLKGASVTYLAKNAVKRNFRPVSEEVRRGVLSRQPGDDYHHSNSVRKSWRLCMYILIEPGTRKCSKEIRTAHPAWITLAIPSARRDCHIDRRFTVGDVLFVWQSTSECSATFPNTSNKRSNLLHMIILLRNGHVIHIYMDSHLRCNVKANR